MPNSTICQSINPYICLHALSVTVYNLILANIIANRYFVRHCNSYFQMMLLILLSKTFSLLSILLRVQFYLELYFIFFSTLDFNVYTKKCFLLLKGIWEELLLLTFCRTWIVSVSVGRQVTMIWRELVLDGVVCTRFDIGLQWLEAPIWFVHHRHCSCPQPIWLVQPVSRVSRIAFCLPGFPKETFSLFYSCYAKLVCVCPTCLFFTICVCALSLPAFS